MARITVKRRTMTKKDRSKVKGSARKRKVVVRSRGKGNATMVVKSRKRS